MRGEPTCCKRTERHSLWFDLRSPISRTSRCEQLKISSAFARLSFQLLLHLPVSAQLLLEAPQRWCANRYAPHAVAADVLLAWKKTSAWLKGSPRWLPPITHKNVLHSFLGLTCCGQVCRFIINCLRLQCGCVGSALQDGCSHSIRSMKWSG